MGIKFKPSASARQNQFLPDLKINSFRLNYRILGMEKLAAFLLNEWAADIKKNQLPSLLGGVGPMYSFVQLCKF